jgi:hypothetical protein
MIQPCEYFLSLNRGGRTSRYGYEWRGSRVHPRSLPALCAIRRQRTPEKPFRQRRGLRLQSRLKYKHDLRHYQAFSVLYKISGLFQSGNLLGEYLRKTNARSVMNSFRTPFRPSFYQHDLSDFVQFVRILNTRSAIDTRSNQPRFTKSTRVKINLASI